MKPFLVLVLAALAHARPEAPGGYSYNAPSSSSSGGHGGLGFGSGGGGGGGSYTGAFSSGSSSGGSGSFGSLGGLGGLGGLSGLGGGSLGGAQQSFSSGSSFGSSSFSGGSSSFGGGSFSGGSSFSGYQQAPVISKHVYVHVAPEEPEIIRPARINAASQPRKHYKIVFIKAPTAPTPTAAQVQLPQQDEEKTIIYVLSKKPEDQPDIQVQQAAPTTPTKPEVYFIKYNTKKDSGINLSANAGISNSYGVPSGPSGPVGPVGPAPSAPSSSYGVPSAHGGPY